MARVHSPPWVWPPVPRQALDLLERRGIAAIIARVVVHIDPIVLVVWIDELLQELGRLLADGALGEKQALATSWNVGKRGPGRSPGIAGPGGRPATIA